MRHPEQCPICGGGLVQSGVSARDRLVTGEGPFAIVECSACCLGLTDPQLDPAELGPYYADSYYEEFYEHSGVRAGLLSRLRGALRRRGSEGRFRRPPYRLDGARPGKVLDVGCGAGELLAQYAAAGWEPYGIDPGEAATKAAAARGATVHTGTLEDRPWPEDEFELVVFSHSLEHIPDPVGAVQEAGRMLAPGGTLAIDVPNWASWQRRLFRGHWSMLDVPRHLQHFSPRALQRLAGRTGLEATALGTNSNAIASTYSLHYLIAGRWSPGWKLWLSYALALPLLPLVFLGDRLGGGDACYAVLTRPA